MATSHKQLERKNFISPTEADCLRQRSIEDIKQIDWMAGETYRSEGREGLSGLGARYPVAQSHESVRKVVWDGEEVVRSRTGLLLGPISPGQSFTFL